MSNNLTNVLKGEMFSQASGDPFLMLIELSHPSFDTIRLVNNTVNVTSRANEYQAFPVRITLPTDDGETAREVTIEFDNVSRELVNEFRTVTDFIDVKIEMVLASNLDYVEIELDELKIRDISYNLNTIQAKLFSDDFLNTELSSERYTPTNFPGIFS